MPTIAMARMAYVLYGIDSRNTAKAFGTSLAAMSAASYPDSIIDS